MESGYSSRVDQELLESLVEETEYLLSNTWELSYLPEAQAEAVAFLVATTRLCPANMSEEHIKKVLTFWNLTLADVEETVFEMLHIHEEEITDSLAEDLYVLNLVFPARN
jgi:hypothetical protein